jgi:hypothetical protein
LHFEFCILNYAFLRNVAVAAKKFPQQKRHVRRQGHFVERPVHQRHPSIARRFVERERHVAHAQTRVPALFDVARRTTEAPDEKVAQPLFRAGKVVCWIHRAENRIRRHLRVERAHETREPILADEAINLAFVNLTHWSLGIGSWSLPRGASAPLGRLPALPPFSRGQSPRRARRRRQRLRR